MIKQISSISLKIKFNLDSEIDGLLLCLNPQSVSYVSAEDF